MYPKFGNPFTIIRTISSSPASLPCAELEAPVRGMGRGSGRAKGSGMGGDELENTEKGSDESAGWNADVDVGGAGAGAESKMEKSTGRPWVM